MVSEPHLTAGEVGALTLRVSRSAQFREQHDKFMVVAGGCLAATILLKLAGVQYLELLYFIDLAILSVFLYEDHFRAKIMWFRAQTGLNWLALIALLPLASAISLRQDFYMPDVGPLQRPFIITIARDVELFVDVFFMLFFAQRFRENTRLLRLGMLTCWNVGLASTLYSFITYPLNVLGYGDFGTFGVFTHRMRGFYNEGGPYGVYLVGVALCGALLLQLGWLKRSRFALGILLILLAMAGSQSKSAYALLAMYLLLIGFHYLRPWLQIVLLVTTVSLLTTAAILLHTRIEDALDEAGQEYAQLSQFRPEDANVVAGRISGGVLAPRMIAVHPFIGVGWGHYLLVRNDPQYRRGTPIVNFALDAPGLGPLDYMVEFGLPLFVLLMWCQWQPVLLVRRQTTHLLPIMLVAFQPLSLLFGAHLNLPHSWFVAAIGMGIDPGLISQRRAPATPAIEAAI